MGIIFFTERNVRGAWVVYGALGIRQYYGYTKSEAQKNYKEEYKQTHVTREGGAR